MKSKWLAISMFGKCQNIKCPSLNSHIWLPQYLFISAVKTYFPPPGSSVRIISIPFGNLERSNISLRLMTSRELNFSPVLKLLAIAKKSRGLIKNTAWSPTWTSSLVSISLLSRYIPKSNLFPLQLSGMVFLIITDPSLFDAIPVTISRK